MRSPGLFPILLLAACSGGGVSEPLENEAADAGNGIAEVYDGNGVALPDGGAASERLDAESTIGAASPQAPASPAPGLSDAQVKAEYSPAHATCLAGEAAAKGEVPAKEACLSAEMRVQDDRLNAAYRAAMGKRDEAGQTALRDEERAWIKARDAQCKAQAQGAATESVAMSQCLLDETIRRRAALQPMAG